MIMMDVPGDNEWLDLLIDQVASRHLEHPELLRLGMAEVVAALLIPTRGSSRSGPVQRWFPRRWDHVILLSSLPLLSFINGPD